MRKLSDRSLHEVVESHPNAVIMMTADWTGRPGLVIEQTLAEIEASYPHVSFFVADHEDYPEFVAEYALTSLPSILGFKAGDVVAVSELRSNKDQIIDDLNEVLNA